MLRDIPIKIAVSYKKGLQKILQYVKIYRQKALDKINLDKGKYVVYLI